MHLDATDPIPAGATAVATLGFNRITGHYCCPFGSPYGFGTLGGFGWYLFPDEAVITDAEASRVDDVARDAPGNKGE